MSKNLFFDLLLDKLKLTPYYRRRKRYDIGEHSYICHTTRMGAVKIGKYCSIGNDVTLGADNHPYDAITTSPFIYSRKKVAIIGGDILVDEKKLLKSPPKPIDKVYAIIENDVWVGEKAIIKAGVRIGNGAVVGAGAIVTHDVPPYAIVAGVPANVIKYRFSEDIIAKLQELKWWDYPEKFIIELPFDNIEGCIKLLEENKHLRK